MAEVNLSFLAEMQKTIRECCDRKPAGNYITSLLQSGLERCVQTVNEECGAVAFAALLQKRDRAIDKSADAFIGLLVLWRMTNIELGDVVGELQNRHALKTPLECGEGSGEKPLLSFLETLEETIRARESQRPAKSYTTSLFNAGIEKCAEKLDEEAGEIMVAALVQSYIDRADDARLRKARNDMIGESADLVFHMMIVWRAAGIELSTVIEKLQERHRQRSQPAPPASVPH